MDFGGEPPVQNFIESLPPPPTKALETVNCSLWHTQEGVKR